MKTRFMRIKSEEDLYRKLTREENRLAKAAQEPNREELMECIGNMRGALELIISKMEKDAQMRTDGSLYERIVALEQEGLMEHTAADYAHKVRMITNEAVHFWGKTVDAGAKKILEDKDEDGLIQIAEEMLNKLAVLSEYYIKDFQNSLPSQEELEIEEEKKESPERDYFLYFFLGVLLMGFVALLLYSIF